MHVVGLDLMNFDQAQIDWLDADLAAANANRAQVPWIMASAHYPLYHATIAANAAFSDTSPAPRGAAGAPAGGATSCDTSGRQPISIR